MLKAMLMIMMLAGALSMSAQSPVKWTSSVKMTAKSEGIVAITGTIEKGWHVYGFNQNGDGPISTTVTVSSPKGVKFTEALKYSPNPVSVDDEMFGCKVTYWEDKVTFTRKFKLNKVKEPKVSFDIYYMACNDSNCQPPTTETLTVTLK